MDISIGIIMVILFIFGFSFGLLIPFIIKKYIESHSMYNNEIISIKEEILRIQKELKKEENESEKKDVADLLPPNIIDEWFNGGSEHE